MPWPQAMLAALSILVAIALVAGVLSLVAYLIEKGDSRPGIAATVLVVLAAIALTCIFHFGAHFEK